MKVLEINAIFFYRSTGTIVSDIQSICLKNEIDCYVAYAYSYNKQVILGYKIGCKFLHKIHALLCRIDGKQAYYSFFETFLLLRYIEKLKPDVVHLHNVHNNYLHLNLLLNYLAKNNIATVVTLHDCWFHTGGCFHYTEVKCNRWMHGCGSCPKKLKDTPAYFRDCSSKILSDRIKYFSAIPRLYAVGVSKWILQDAQRVVFKNRPSSVIYNGVDLEIFKPQGNGFRKSMGWESKEVILGPATKWLASNNESTLKYFLDHVSHNQILALFGVTGERTISHPQLYYIKYTNNRIRMAEIYSSADVMVNCSFEDSLSFINIESQACGTPVVTYDGTGIEETVDGLCGFSVKSGDYVSLFETTCCVLNHPPSSDSCRAWVSKMFDKNINYTRYIDVYRSIIKSR